MIADGLRLVNAAAFLLPRAIGGGRYDRAIAKTAPTLNGIGAAQFFVIG